MLHTPEAHFPRDVAHALTVLGNGFLAHAHNHVLRDALAAGRLSAAASYAQLARLVYRLLWLLAAEAQGALPAPQAPIILDNVPTDERHVIATFLTVLETHA